MPMPFALDHINIWAIREERGWAIVDTGLRTTEVVQAWHQLLDEAGPLKGLPVTRLIVTHMPPDHIGMAGWLTRRFRCALWMSRLEYLSCRVMMADTGHEAPDEGIEFYRMAGWDETALDHYRARFGDFGRMIHPMPDSFVRLSDGQRILLGAHEWEVVVGRGHSPEHACLYCRDLDLLISGDQVLPRITSNTSVFPTEPGANPIRDWLESIPTLRARIPDTALVLPAHNEPFQGLHARLAQLEASTLQHIERIRSQLEDPKRVSDLVQAIFRRPLGSDSMQLSLATGETIAGLNYLLNRGEIRVVGPGRDGVPLYQALR